MRKKYISFSFILFLSFFTSSANVFCQHINEELRLLKTVLDENHVSPPEINDQFSKNVLKRFIKLVDPSGMILTGDDYEKIKAFETTLDDEYSQAQSKFLAVFTPLYKERLLKYKEAIERITSQPIDFEKKDYLFSAKDDESVFRLKNEETSFNLLERVIKYHCLVRYEQEKKNQNPDMDAIIKQVKGIELRKVKRILEHAAGFEKYIANRFLLAISLCYDPHTVFMNQTDVQGFLSGISTEGLSFGFYFDENEEGSMCIVDIVPGSPAWNSNELHTGDVLLAMKWQDKEEVDFDGASIEEVYAVINQNSTGSAEFTFRTKEGKILKVSLAKAITRQDENIVKGYIINGTKKIGYISLPGFYSGEDENATVGCANDVGSAIIKMKKEGIEGLILDIRNNGGGSVKESSDLAGIFIDQGPLVMMNGRDNKPFIMKDANRGTIFDGPLVVMVNRNSASASEILAAALQDYNRALIVGSNTYGKATGQVIFPVSVQSGKESFAKVTGVKIYRINGFTAQFIGVKPDIELPDFSEMIYDSESSTPHALKPDSLLKKAYYTPFNFIPVDSLKIKLMARMNASYPLFKLIEAVKTGRKVFNEAQNQDSIPLNRDDFSNWKSAFDKKFPKEEDFANSEKQIELQILQADEVWLNQDSYAKEMHTIVLDNIKKDLHVAECYKILLDWIKN